MQISSLRHIRSLLISGKNKSSGCGQQSAKSKQTTKQHCQFTFSLSLRLSENFEFPWIEKKIEVDEKNSDRLTGNLFRLLFFVFVFVIYIIFFATELIYLEESRKPPGPGCSKGG